MPTTQRTTNGTGSRHRLQLEFSASAYERLNELKALTDAASYSELVRDALRVYGWMIEKRRDGQELALFNPNEPNQVRVVDLLLK